MMPSWTTLLFTIITLSNIQHTLSATCGGRLTAYSSSYKHLSSPGGTNNKVYCVWTVQASATYHIKVEFMPITNIRQGSNRACIDSVRVFDGPYNTSYLLGTVCGTSMPTFISSGKTFRLEYRTVGPSYLSRFSLRYTAGKFKACGNMNLVATSSKKSISSPDYPSPTTSSTFCKWRIDAGLGGTMKINFTTSNCSTSYVRIFDGFDDRSRAMSGWCGSGVGPQRSSGRYIFIEYSTRVHVSSRFKLQYWKHGSDSSPSYAKDIAGGVVGAGSFVVILFVIIYCVVKRSENRPFSVFA